MPSLSTDKRCSPKPKHFRGSGPPGIKKLKLVMINTTNINIKRHLYKNGCLKKESGLFSGRPIRTKKRKKRTKSKMNYKHPSTELKLTLNNTYFVLQLI